MMKDWLKLAGRKGAEKDGKAMKIWRIEKNERIGLKARKKFDCERKCFKRVGMNRTDYRGVVVCFRSKGSYIYW